MPNHPFAGRKGSATRNRFASALFVEQLGQCAMCQQQVNPTLKGRSDSRAAVVDHVRPWRLRPDLSLDQSNLWLLCAGCHNGTCEAIEKQHWPDAERIAAEKRTQRGYGADGWRI